MTLLMVFENAELQSYYETFALASFHFSCELTLWFVALQTAVAVGEELDDKLPHHEYYEYFGPDYTLHIAPSNMANQNSRKEIDNLRLAFYFATQGV